MKEDGYNKGARTDFGSVRVNEIKWHAKVGDGEGHALFVSHFRTRFSRVVVARVGFGLRFSEIIRVGPRKFRPLYNSDFYCFSRAEPTL